MIIGELLDLRSQGSLPWFVPNQKVNKAKASPPDTIQVYINRRENIEQVLDVHIL